ncbi:MAG: hypothetical protein OEZ06_06045 [Myxococcales bacterium]|nr:hypothetical protein [Myxococcales bacterium]
MPRPTPALALLGFALLLSRASPARAYEDQLTVGLDLGYALSAGDRDSTHGALLALQASVGLSAVWSARARLGAALHPASPTMQLGLVGGELLYLIDILELVPVFGLGADAMLRRYPDTTADPPEQRLDAAVHALLGLDYLLSRSLILGLALRPHLRLTDLGGDPFYFMASGAVSWVFDL